MWDSSTAWPARCACRRSTSSGTSTSKAPRTSRWTGRRSSAPTTPRCSTPSSCRWSLPRRITYVGKAEYLDDWKTKHLFPALGMIPIDRSGGDASQRALNAAARVLEAGEYFGIYPEGTTIAHGQALPGPHRTRAAGPAHRRTDHPGGHPRQPRRDAPGCQAAATSSDPCRSAWVGPSRWTATAIARTTASCSARSPTRSCSRSATCRARSTSTPTPPSPTGRSWSPSRHGSPRQADGERQMGQADATLAAAAADR